MASVSIALVAVVGVFSAVVIFVDFNQTYPCEYDKIIC